MTGKTIWRRRATEQVPIEGHHRDNDFASASPTTDGHRLYVWFGSAGLYCYSLDGELVWQRDLGAAQTRLSFGEASSPVVHDDKLIVNRDLDSQSYITVLSAKTGDTIWRRERDEPSCWATPIVVQHEGVEQLITNAHNRVRSYNLANGDLIWECGGQVSNVTPSPVTDGVAVYCMSGYRGSAAMALPLDATRDITDSDQIIWSKTRGTPYVPSPILYDGFLYFNQSNDAILTCLDAKTGETLIERTRMPGLRGLYASPVGASGRVYFVGRNGVTLVLEKGPEFKVLATNKLAEPIDATPALVGTQIFLRSEKSLYCIGERLEAL
jgi:outer membrane protein assembly factor BamB